MRDATKGHTLTLCAPILLIFIILFHHIASLLAQDAEHWRARGCLPKDGLVNGHEGLVGEGQIPAGAAS